MAVAVRQRRERFKVALSLRERIAEAEFADFGNEVGLQLGLLLAEREGYFSEIVHGVASSGSNYNSFRFGDQSWVKGIT
jgi:hypothetical protein